MLNTSLIYTNKGKAVVKNDTDGSWLCETPSVIVNAGDLVSVESIAVSTDGTGADVIEIPRQQADYEYSTTKMKIEFMFYIHANFRYCCVLPVAGQDIYETDQTLLNYGCVKPNVFVRTSNTDYVPKNAFPTQRYAGTRLYIGTFGIDGGNPITPSKSTTIDDENLSTGKEVFNFLTTTIGVEADSGYNTPQNIASKITEQLHSAMITPNNANVFENPKAFYQENLSYSNTNRATQQATATSAGSSVMTIFGLPNQYFGKTASSSNPYWYSTYSNFLAVKNPYYWYWGSRLHASAPQGSAKENTWANANLNIATPNALTQADIINLNDLAWDGLNVVVEEGDVMILNLPYNEETILKVSKLIHTIKYYQSVNKTQEEMIEDKDSFSSPFPIGKYDDGQNTPYDSNSSLPAKVIIPNTRNPSRVRIKTFYNETYWGSAKISTTGTITTQVGLSIDNDTTLGGLSPRDISKKYDVNIVRVNTEVGGSIYPVIGLVLESQFLGNTYYFAGNYALVDLAFSRDVAHACMIMSPDLRQSGNKHTIDDMVKGFNIGSPNIELAFNADRSRFAWKQMYWSNYIGNDSNDGTEANPSADQEVFTCNKIKTSPPDYYKPPVFGNPSQLIYDQYAQSGLGFYRLYVQNFTGGYDLIDGDDDEDIKRKYDGSFLKRIGFEYFDLFGNDFGLPNVIYQERQMFGNSQVEYPQYFPFPLTCNPQIDTAFNISINETDQNFPAFDLSLERNGTNINVAVETAQILARNKPQKLATPFWLIESDIIPAVKYYVDGIPKNVVAICNRAYGSGDFVFSFATDYKFIATKSFVLTHIKSSILTSELLPADIEDNTTIVYKIESPILPNFVSATTEMEEEEAEMRKGN